MRDYLIQRHRREDLAVESYQELTHISAALPESSPVNAGDDFIIGSSFGNVLVTEFFRVPLTTVRQPKLRLGTAAMEAMQQLLRGERPETRRLQAEIITRQSTGAPPKLA